MKTICKSIYRALLSLLLVVPVACDDNAADLKLDGDTRVESITVSGFAGDINHTACTIRVDLPVSTDLSRLTVDEIVLSPGATADLPAGTEFNGVVPRAIRVVNGDAFSVYTMTAKHDNVEFLSFTLNGIYSGSIDNEARTITVFVPVDADVTAMVPAYTATEGAEVTPAAGTEMDFTDPQIFTVTLRTARIDYIVSVVRGEMSQAPKAFVGNAASMAQLGDEARAACQWMMENVPNVTYVAIQEVIDKKVKLEDYKMIWCHFDWTDWPSQFWDSRDAFNSYWLHGGSILASRDGARYINDVWRIARDQQSPNDMSGGESVETLTADLGFTITGHEEHPLYQGLVPDADGRVLLLSAGCSATGRTLQWLVGKYGTMSDWEERTGAKALASGHDYDPDCVTVAEFEPYEALKGFVSGRVVTVGTPAYEWYDKNGTDNPYRENRITFTRNAINYLCQ